MKKVWTEWGTVLLCLLLLTACGGGKEAAPWTAEDTEAILNSGAFSDELEALDLDTAFALYGLAGGGLDRTALTDGVVHYSSGATCEELALLIFQDQETAQSAEQPLKDYLQSQLEANQDYRPGEIPKLNSALLERRENVWLLVVAADAPAAMKAAGLQ